MPMLGRESKLGFNNPICWFFGHDVGGKTVDGTFRWVSGEVGAAWQYYCKRCQDPDHFPNYQFPDRRNLYRRTIPVWINQLRNRWRYRNFNKSRR